MFEFVPTPLASGGVGMYINNLRYSVLERTSNQSFQVLWIEIHFENKKNIICGIIYRQNNSPDTFLSCFENALEKYSIKKKPVFILGDFNIDLLKSETCSFSHEFLLSLQSFDFLPTIDKPTRVHNNSATLIGSILTNNREHSVLSGNVISDISDHFT